MTPSPKSIPIIKETAMSIPNRVSLDVVAIASIGEIAALPSDQLALLQQDLIELLASAKRIKERLDTGLELKYRDRAADLRQAAGKDTGSVRFEDGNIIVVADLPKRVKWEQPRLAQVVERIRAGGDDPNEYVTIEYSVSERAYAAWPQSIRAAFARARTVETCKPGYRFEPIKGGA
jgi:hypothetical protein